MNHLLKSFALLVGLAVSTTLFAQQEREVPSIEIQTLDGKTINIQDYANNDKVTILSFWATWCSPCKKELDAIADVYEDWQEDYDVELVAITIDTRRALAKVPAMVETKGWDFTVLSDANQELQRALNFQTIPQTFVIDKSGQIVYSHSGYLPGDEYDLEDKIKELAEK